MANLADGNNDNPYGRDETTSSKLLALVRWYASYKGRTLPTSVSISRNACFKWIHANVGRIEREDAYAASHDFKNIRLDQNDPVSIIIALKYADTADRNRLPHEDLITEAIHAGEHPNSVRERLGLRESELWKVLDKIIIDDLLYGITPEKIQEKYDISDHNLGRILNKFSEDYPDAKINWE